VTDERSSIKSSPAAPPSIVAQAHLQSVQPNRRGDDDSAPTAAPFQALDRALHANTGRVSGGLAPSALLGGFLHWAAHLAASPGKQFELATEAVNSGIENLAGLDRLARPKVGGPVMLPPLGRANSEFVLLGDAPGRYVLMT
jgi:Poly-beta-hydroxybutyrate polymerase N terminal